MDEVDKVKTTNGYDVNVLDIKNNILIVSKQTENGKVYVALLDKVGMEVTKDMTKLDKLST